MTDLATALADNEHLEPFEGVRVLRTQVAITNAGDGLSEALAIEPHALPLGARVHVVLECRVQQVRHVPTNKDDPTEGLARIHVLRAGRATLVDRATVEEALNEQEDRIRRAREEAAGIERLPGMDDPERDEEDSIPAELDELNAKRPRRRVHQ